MKSEINKTLKIHVYIWENSYYIFGNLSSIIKTMYNIVLSLKSVIFNPFWKPNIYYIYYIIINILLIIHVVLLSKVPLIPKNTQKKGKEKAKKIKTRKTIKKQQSELLLEKAVRAKPCKNR